MPQRTGAAFSFEGIGTQLGDFHAARRCPAAPHGGPAGARGDVRRRVVPFPGRLTGQWPWPGSPAATAFPQRPPALGELYRTLYGLTGGAMTPLIGASLERLGYDAAYYPPAVGLARCRRRAGRTSWTGTAPPSRTTAPVVLDIGAAGKGLLVDLLASALEAGGHGGLHGGRQRRPAGPRPGYRPGGRSNIRTTRPRPSAWWNLAAGHCALPPPTAGPGATDSTMSWTATTGQPVRTAVATWALADTAAVADALATALFFVPGACARGVIRRFLADGFFRRQRRLFRRI